MALTKEQFKKLRARGLSVDQIVKFEKGATPQAAKQNIKKLEDNLAQKVLQGGADFTDKTLGKVSKFLFGGFGKAAGGLLLSTTGRGAELLGRTPETKDAGRMLREKGEKALTTGTAATAGLELYPGGGTLTRALSKIPGGDKAIKGITNIIESVPEKLRGQAIENMQSVLGATTKKFKDIAGRVAPELAERKITALSRAGLEKKAAKEAGIAGRAIEEFVEEIPKETKLATKPLIDAIEETKKGFTVKGVVVEPEKLKVANEIQDIVKEFGDELEAENIIQLRRVWDETIKKSGKGFTPDIKDTFRLQVKKEATNAIRNELGKEFPELDKINKEFSFWKNVKDTVSETRKRTAGKSGLVAPVAGQIGAGAGFIEGGIRDAVLIGAAAKNFTKLTQSAAWKTMSAKKKMQLAEAIESGNANKVAEVIKRLLLGIEGE
jgi:hypothetical protein